MKVVDVEVSTTQGGVSNLAMGRRFTSSLHERLLPSAVHVVDCIHRSVLEYR
jgi:hypothetical protein